jgi:hypothetical protein
VTTARLATATVKAGRSVRECFFVCICIWSNLIVCCVLLTISAVFVDLQNKHGLSLRENVTFIGTFVSSCLYFFFRQMRLQKGNKAGDGAYAFIYFHAVHSSYI